MNNVLLIIFHRRPASELLNNLGVMVKSLREPLNNRYISFKRFYKMAYIEYI
jgi:hypothetical protein